MNHRTPPDRNRPGRLVVYGATGYTGLHVARRAVALGLDVVLAGRDASRLEAIAADLRRPFVAVPVEDRAGLRGLLMDADCLLNVAGPFAHTAGPLLQACLDTGTHYLDTTAEFGVFEASAARSQDATVAGITIMSGVGWDVVPSDALAVHTARRVAQPVRLRIGLKVSGEMSHGSVVSAAGITEAGHLVRRAGVITELPVAATAEFDFGTGPEKTVGVPMGDLVTGWQALRIPDIEVFAAIDVTAAADPREPSTTARYQAVAEVTGDDGSVVSSRIDTVNGYTYTQHAAVEVARRVLSGGVPSGFRSPAEVWGPDLAFSISGTRVTDV